jgi:hypothetical protein
MAVATVDRRRRRARVGALVVVICIVAAIVAVVVVNPFARPGSSGPGFVDNAAPTSLATVQQNTIRSQDPVQGTLGYAGSYSILNETSGAYTRLPSAGALIKPGQPLYWVDGKPVVLLFGHTPAYRTLSERLSGADVQQLNADLVSLGYATTSEIDPTSDYFSAETAYAVERLQAHLDLTETGSLALGSAVFEPGAMRLTTVTPTLGARAAAGSPFAQATSTGREVSVSLDATQQSEVKAGDRVTITLPDNSVTPGVITSVGKVASQGSNPTVTVYVRPLDPRATGHLDQAPVNVSITTATARNALIVPVDSLLSLASGGYAVEVVGAHGVHSLVGVKLGLFDDADGVVQVTGTGLSAGERVVVPTGT